MLAVMVFFCALFGVGIWQIYLIGQGETKNQIETQNRARTAALITQKAISESSQWYEEFKEDRRPTWQFIVIKDKAPATYSEETWNQLYDHTINNNQKAIIQMAKHGEIEFLKKDEVVEVLTIGIPRCEIRKNGKKMYTDMDFLKRK